MGTSVDVMYHVDIKNKN